MLGLCCCSRAISLVAVSRVYSSLQGMGFHLWRLLLWSPGSRAQGLQYSQHAGSVLVAHVLGRSWHVGSSWSSIKLMTLTLVGGFFTTEPLGKPHKFISFRSFTKALSVGFSHLYLFWGGQAFINWQPS